MLRKILPLSVLATVVLAQHDGEFPDLLSLLNETEGFSYLNAYINNFPAVKDFVAPLTNITVLAPSDVAIWEFLEDPRYADLEARGADYLQTLISYHILNGVYDNITDWHAYPTLLNSPEYTNVTGGQLLWGYYNHHGFELSFYSGSDLDADAPNQPIHFNGGIVYPISNVLQIPISVSEEAATNWNGSAFVEALEKTGLREEVELLKDVTFFVPSNDAFQAVEQSLSELSIEELTEVLKYHIVPGKFASWDSLENGTTLETLQGQELTAFVNEEYYTFVDGAALEAGDILVSNGILMIIDNVLKPDATVKAPGNDSTAGVPAYPTGTSPSATGGSDGEGSATATSSAVEATYTGGAASLQTGALSLAALVVAVAGAICF